MNTPDIWAPVADVMLICGLAVALITGR